MTEYFDRYQWAPQLFRTPKELNAALESFEVKGKKIKTIHTIGLAHNMEPWAYRETIYTILAGKGIPYKDIVSEKVPNIEQTLFPCEVVICEPIVFVFEDDSTLEIMPDKKSGLLFAVNQIPPSVKDGLNHSNVDSEYLFRRAIGCSIQEIQTVKTHTQMEHTGSGCESRDAASAWKLWTAGEYAFYFRRRLDGWYQFGITSDRIGCHTEKVSYADIKKASRHSMQIPIVEGHDSSGYFGIMPVRHTTVSDEHWDGIEKCREQEISIEESHVAEFLYYFLDLYFDDNYPYGSARDSHSDSGFQWNLEYNIYTYETTKRMLNAIAAVSALLRTDFDNPVLTDIKKMFHPFAFSPDRTSSPNNLTEAEQERLIRENIRVATDFYDRFVQRMRLMMEHADNFELISFMGP